MRRCRGCGNGADRPAENVLPAGSGPDAGRGGNPPTPIKGPVLSAAAVGPQGRDPTMTARHSPRRPDSRRALGFTLVELLIVVVILGVLAAIAVPIFLNQKAKAQVAAQQASVAALGSALATGQSTNGTVQVTATSVIVTDGAGAVTTVPLVGTGSVRIKVGALDGTAIVTGTPLSGTTWCVSADNPSGGVLDLRTGTTSVNTNGTVCYAAAALTTAASSGGVTIADVPTGLAATPAVSMIALMWTAPTFTGGAPITDYTVQYRTSAGPGAWTSFPHAVSVTPTTNVTGLANGTAYDFRVAAENLAGTGSYSTTVTASPNVTPAAPTALAGTAGNAEAALTWAAPAANGGTPVTDYTIRYRTSAGPGAWATFADGTSTTASATVTGLTNSTAYDVQVAAVNAAGTGSYSSTATVIPVLPWNAATGGTVTTIANYNGTGQTWKMHAFTATGALSVTSGLRAFRVLAVGGGGNGGAGSHYYSVGGSGGNGQSVDTTTTFTAGLTAVTIGGSGAASSVGSVTAAAGGSGGNAYNGGASFINGSAGSGHATLSSTITGAAVTYSAGTGATGTGGVAGSPGGFPGGGGGGGGGATNQMAPAQGGGAGGSGLVIVAYQTG